MRVYRAVSLEEYADLQTMGRFRPGVNSLLGKWFADSYDGVLLHAKAHYPDGRSRIVATDIPDHRLPELYRVSNLDGLSDSSYIYPEMLNDFPPILEVEDG